jgi:NAD(P)H-flavin reductase
MGDRMTVEILQPAPYRITRKEYETEDSFTIELEPVEGAAMTFSPGQFNMLYAFGVGEVPISFSDCTSIVHTIKIVGNVTKVLSRCNVGDQIGVRGPYGQPWPVEKIKKKNILLVAGGIGLAPIRSLIYYLLANKSNDQMITLLYGARNPSDCLYVEELSRWKEQLDGHVYVTVDVADSAWAGNVGVVTSLIPKIPFPLNDCVALLCGPEIMMRMTARDLLNKGISTDDIYLSMERNMKCAVGHCGRCQLAPHFICKDGPVFSYPQIQPYFGIKEL